MNVSIWDLDFFYGVSKLPNPDVMKIASYHKQCGDSVNFILKEYQIDLNFDLMYIIKEESKTKNPPMRFLLDRRVKWWGDAVSSRVAWRMSKAMLACRPDYQLYPEVEGRNKILFDSDHIRLLDNQGKLLPLYQNWENAKKNGRKRSIEDDENLWFADKDTVLAVLEKLRPIRRLYFAYPVSLHRLIADKDIKTAFMRLHLEPGCNIQWMPIKIDELEAAFNFLKEFKAKNTGCKLPLVTFNLNVDEYWSNPQKAVEEFEICKKVIVLGKENRLMFCPTLPPRRLDNLYYEVFEELNYFMTYNPTYSWLESLTRHYSSTTAGESVSPEIYINAPNNWHPVFRALLRQTYKDKKFLLTQWGDKSFSADLYSELVLDKEFKNGL